MAIKYVCDKCGEDCGPVYMTVTFTPSTAGQKKKLLDLLAERPVTSHLCQDCARGLVKLVGAEVPREATATN